MGEAARILAQGPREEFREMIHDEVDKWVDQIIDEVFVDGKEPTVMELSELFSKTKQAFFGACRSATILCTRHSKKGVCLPASRMSFPAARRSRKG